MQAGIRYPTGMFSCYRPQTKFAKVVFLHLSVILFSGGVCLSACLGYTPPGSRHPPREQIPPTPMSRHPPEQTPPSGSRHPPGADTPPPEQCMLGDTGNKRAVYILLECRLVINVFTDTSSSLVDEGSLQWIVSYLSYMLCPNIAR